MDKEALFKARLTEADFDVEGVGTIRIRSLSRSEALMVKGKDYEPGALERKLISLACVEPELTEDDVRQWQEASSAGELEPVVTAILELSGMVKSAPRQAMETFREGQGS